MGPLPAVFVAVYLFLLGLTQGGWATISGKVLGVIAIITAIVIVLDLFWAHRTVFTTRRPVVQR